ncbi:carbonic anhydrase [bacterium]|nr:carbonic anhydrase [bacterium]
MSRRSKAGLARLWSAIANSLQEASEQLRRLTEEAAPVLSVEEGLERLREGNRRFQRNRQCHPHGDLRREREVVQSQAPFAVILSCADSRVVPEILFDQGIGDLFVIRIAGNVATPEVLASIEYAVLHLGIELFVVLAHENCGAVHAAHEAVREGEDAPHLSALLAQIAKHFPQEAREELSSNSLAEVNARSTIQECLERSPLLKQRQREGRLLPLPAYFSLSDGGVYFLPDPAPSIPLVHGTNPTVRGPTVRGTVGSGENSGG